MTESYFLFNAGSIALGLLVAMMFWYIFEAIRKWANKPVKDAPKHENWDFTKPISGKVNYYSYHPYNYENHHDPKKHQQMYFLTRQEAEKVLDRMHEILNEYGTVTIGDLYDITGERAAFSDMKYGWKELPIGDSIVRDYKGYTIDFPTPIHLD